MFVFGATDLLQFRKAFPIALPDADATRQAIGVAT